MMRPVLFLLLVSLAVAFAAFTPPENATMVLEVDNISREKGTVWVGLYDSEESFLDREKAILVEKMVTRSGKMEIQIPNLPLGNYAIAVFHDENNNGEMDRNLLGIPSEPFSFIRRPKSKWRLPRFEEVVLQFDHTNQVFYVPLRKWWRY